MSNLPKTMQGYTAHNGQLVLGTHNVPAPQAGEVLIAVAASGINRPDILQRMGKYDPPAGTTPILGLEVAGTILACGPKVARWKVGDKVCALLAGGGYAEYAAAPEGQCLPWPVGFSAIEAAILPECIFTVWANMFEAGQLREGEVALIHGGSSGIGSTAIQMAKAFGARVITTVGNAEKAEFCKKLGADCVINYKTQDYVEAIKNFTNGAGVNVVLDMVGGDYIAKDMSVMAYKGRHVSIAMLGGSKTAIDIRLMMGRQIVLTGSTLRPRPVPEKARIAREVEAHIWPKLLQKIIKPQCFQAFPFNAADGAHKTMEIGAHMGKMALVMNTAS